MSTRSRSTQSSHIRPSKHSLLVLLGIVLYWTVGVACAGAGFSTRGTAPTRAPVADSTSQSNQATLPNWRTNIDTTWETADSAFRAGDAVRAQIDFGTVYIMDPSYRQGQIIAALQETCRVLGNNCALVMGRLDALHAVFSEEFGNPDSWVEQQRQDFSAIIACYDNALLGNFDLALSVGAPVVEAPLPAFSNLARDCVNQIQGVRSYTLWTETYPGFINHYNTLSEAIEAEDWDAIVEFYPSFSLQAESIERIVHTGVLAGNPNLSEQTNEAAEILATMGIWETAYYTTYEEMRDKISLLEDNDEYQQELIEYEQVFAPIPELQDEIATLEIALEATSGRERRNISSRIDSNESDIRRIRRQLRRIMADINSIREDVGLPERSVPYGI